MEIPKEFEKSNYDIKITFLMASILRMHKEFLSKEMKEKITPGEFPFLMLLHIEGNKTQKDMASTFCFTQSNAAKAIRNLEDKGLIVRKMDDNNRRQKIVSLTEKGEKICKQTLKIEDKWEELLIGKFAQEEKKFLKEALYTMFLESIKAKEQNM